MSKSIAIVGPAWPFRGGLANFDERLARAWTQKGAQVTLHTFTKQYPGFLFPGTSQFTEKSAPAGLQIERTLHAYNPLQWSLAAHTIASRNYDLVLIRFWIPAMGPSLGYVADKLVHETKTRVVALVDNLNPHESRPLDRWLANRLIRHPHAFVTMSEAVAKPLRSLVGDRPVCLSPHPLYDDYGPQVDQGAARRKLGVDEKARVLLFFGFIRKYKGLDLLLEALSGDWMQASNVKLVVAGEWYDNPDAYKSLATKNGLDGHIVWHDHFIAEDDVATYFSAADAVIQPYRNATQSGISALAYAYGRPLISTNVGGLSEMIDDGKTGYLCDPNPTSIRDAVNRWMHESDPTAIRDEIATKRSIMTWDRLIDTIESCR